MMGRRYTVHRMRATGRWFVYDNHGGGICELWARRSWAKRSARQLNRRGRGR